MSRKNNSKLTTTNKPRKKCKNWRRDPRWHEVKEECKKRDNYTCQICGTKKGQLDVHHMDHATYFPDERFDLDNLVTLCHRCHSQFHNNFKRSYRQKCTKYDFDNFKCLVNYFKEKFGTKESK